MEPTDRPTTEAPPKPRIKERLEDNVIWVMIVALASGFAAGAGGFKWGIDAFNQDIVTRGTYILRRDLVGNLLKSEAIIAIDFLIQNGQSLDGDAPQSRTWLMQVLAFIHGLNLEKDFNWQGNRVSAVEADIRYALTDPSLEIQVQKVLGILRGLRAAFQARVQTT
jgi:hypothetical protein